MFRVKLIMSAALAVFAFSAVASAIATAAPAGWMVGGTMLVGTKALATTAKVDEKGKLTSAGVTIQCNGENLEGIGPVINESSLMGDVTSLQFTECHSETENCTLATTTVKTLPLLIDVTLQATPIIRATFLPVNTAKVFTTLEYVGENCALAGKQAVTGRATVLAPTGQTENTLQLIKAETLEASELKEGSGAATLAGSALLRLEKGQAWSFL